MKRDKVDDWRPTPWKENDSRISIISVPSILFSPSYSFAFILCLAFAPSSSLALSQFHSFGVDVGGVGWGWVNGGGCNGGGCNGSDRKYSQKNENQASVILLRRVSERVYVCNCNWYHRGTTEIDIDFFSSFSVYMCVCVWACGWMSFFNFVGVVSISFTTFFLLCFARKCSSWVTMR